MRLSFILALIFILIVNFGCQDSDSGNTNLSAPNLEPVYRFHRKNLSVVSKEVVWCTNNNARLLFKTRDGGKSWSEKTIRSGSFVIHAFFFLDENTGWVVGGEKGEMWFTDDGGESWIKKIDLRSNVGKEYYGSAQINFLDNNYGWIISAFSLAVTYDGGINFNVANNLPAGNQPQLLFAIDKENQWLLTSNLVLRTKNGGKEWIRKFSKNETSFVDLFAFSESEAWVLSSRSIIYTSDGGSQWSEEIIDNSVTPDSVFFTKSNIGWVSGRARLKDSMTRSVGILLGTTDAGESWTKVTFEQESYIEKVFFLDDQNGWLEGEKNVYYTNDGGKTWRVFFKLDVS